jgi:catechol 2,3-dioxygenase-like lactoylglutathione lyase family enzyme
VLAIGNITIYVRDLEKALTFWTKGLELTVAEQDQEGETGFARLDFPEGGPSLVVVAPGEDFDQPEEEQFSPVTFDLMTTTFDQTLLRMLEHGGQQLSETELYNELKLTTVADPEGNAFELIELPPEVDQME